MCNDHLQPFVEDRLNELASFYQQKVGEFPSGSAFTEQLRQVLLISNFAYEQWMRMPQQLQRLYESGDAQQSFDDLTYQQRLSVMVANCSDTEQLKKQLRHFYHYELLRIIWRDSNQLAALAEIMLDLSHLAEACIQQAALFLQQQLEQTFGVPCDRQGRSQQLQIIAMGKLGAGELNLSSDVDLIFCYPQDGDLSDKCSHQQFFARLVRQFINVMSDVTEDGFVLRVDTRLRPYGLSGAMAMSFESMSEYYQNEARDWERYAMIKARVLLGDQADNQALQMMLHDFTYRVYLDFSAIEALRRLKKRIHHQVNLKGMENNIKLGSGGIREIEFIAQVFQLIHGGNDYSLQVRGLVSALTSLQQNAYLEQVPMLIEAYQFLRTLEHRLQAMNNQQTHSLPNDLLLQARIAASMGMANWQQLLDKLNGYRQFVSEQFSQVIDRPERLPTVEKRIVDETVDEQANFQQMLDRWLQHFQQADLSELAKERLSRLMPLLVEEVKTYSSSVELLDRSCSVVDSLLQHSTYLLAFEENPQALDTLLQLCRASPWISRQVARYPILLAELINERVLYLVQGMAQMQQYIMKQLSYADWQNEDQVLDIFRRFKRRAVLHIAAADVMHKLSIMRVSDGLTDIAIAALRSVLQYSWQAMVERHGYPKREDGSLCELDFVIIAYGKLGGIELSYRSDLDLVFVHDADEQAMTSADMAVGEQSISGSQFYLRLAKKMLHVLAAQMSVGRLYQIDTRLRPGGASGLLVPSFKAFSHYQRESAWIWEHQALVRARVVAGDERLAEKFNTVRADILSQQRDIKQLQQEVAAMRRKMTENSPAIPKGMFDLKKSRGGMTDIEFIAQFIVLAWSHKVPELMIFTDNIRIFETCESGRLLSRKEVDQLCHAYRDLRHALHRLALQNLPDHVPKTEFLSLRNNVAKIWKKLLRQPFFARDFMKYLEVSHFNLN